MTAEKTPAEQEEESELIQARDAAKETASSFVDVVRILNSRICDVQTQITLVEERLSKLEGGGRKEPDNSSQTCDNHA